MARAEIYIEDEGPGGGVAFRVRYMGAIEGQPDPNSNAHKLATQLRLFCDKHQLWKKDETMEDVSPPSHVVTSERRGLIRV